MMQIIKASEGGRGKEDPKQGYFILCNGRVIITVLLIWTSVKYQELNCNYFISVYQKLCKVHTLIFLILMRLRVLNHFPEVSRPVSGISKI